MTTSYRGEGLEAGKADDVEAWNRYLDAPATACHANTGVVDTTSSGAGETVVGATVGATAKAGGATAATAEARKTASAATVADARARKITDGSPRLLVLGWAEKCWVTHRFGGRRRCLVRPNGAVGRGLSVYGAYAPLVAFFSYTSRRPISVRSGSCSSIDSHSPAMRLDSPPVAMTTGSASSSREMRSTMPSTCDAKP